MLSICFSQVRFIYLSWQPGHVSNLLQIIWQFPIVSLTATRPEIADILLYTVGWNYQSIHQLQRVALLMFDNVISSYILLGMSLLINAGRILSCGRYYHNKVSRCHFPRNHCPAIFCKPIPLCIYTVVMIMYIKGLCPLSIIHSVTCYICCINRAYTVNLSRVWFTQLIHWHVAGIIRRKICHLRQIAPDTHR